MRRCKLRFDCELITDSDLTLFHLLLLEFELGLRILGIFLIVAQAVAVASLRCLFGMRRLQFLVVVDLAHSDASF